MGRERVALVLCWGWAVPLKPPWGVSWGRALLGGGASRVPHAMPTLVAMASLQKKKSFLEILDFMEILDFQRNLRIS